MNEGQIGRSNADVITDFNGCAPDDGQAQDHDHYSYKASESSRREDTSVSTDDQLVFDSSLLPIDYIPHLHVAQTKKELRGYWKSDHASMLYLQPTGQLFLNYEQVPVSEYESAGLIATLKDYPVLSEDSFLYL